MSDILLFTILSYFLMEISHTDILNILKIISENPAEYIIGFLFLFCLYLLFSLIFSKKRGFIFIGIYTFIFSIANYMTSTVNDKFFSFRDVALLGGKSNVFVMFIPIFLKPVYLAYIFSTVVFLIICVRYSKHIETNFNFIKTKSLYELLCALSLSFLIISPQIIPDAEHFFISATLNDFKISHIFSEEGVIQNQFLHIEKNGNLENLLGEEHKNADVVIIQSETFFNPEILRDTKYDTDVTKNFKKYQSQGLSGRVFVPVLGGLTCNSEFEFLTGMRISKLQHMDVPYEMMDYHNIEALPKDFVNSGYSAIAVHGYERNFFNRDKVYPVLGIQKFIAQDDFNSPTNYGPWTSDEDVFNKILEELDGKGNKFIFTVTVQNHGPFEISEGNPINVTGISDADRESFTNYLNGLKISDDALENFMQALSKRQKETIVCFYGDHIIGKQHRSIMNDSYFKEDINRRYMTDYFLWSSKGTIPSNKRNISILTLGRLTKACVLPLTYYDNFVMQTFDNEKTYFGEITPKEKENAYKTVINRMMKDGVLYPEIYENMDRK